VSRSGVFKWRSSGLRHHTTRLNLLSHISATLVLGVGDHMRAGDDLITSTRNKRNSRVLMVRRPAWRLTRSRQASRHVYSARLSSFTPILACPDSHLPSHRPFMPPPCRCNRPPFHAEQPKSRHLNQDAAPHPSRVCLDRVRGSRRDVQG
jgi:hypothetical protein